MSVRPRERGRDVSGVPHRESGAWNFLLVSPRDIQNVAVLDATFVTGACRWPAERRGRCLVEVEKAIAYSRSPRIVQGLLLTQSLGDLARRRLWETIGRASWRMGKWLLEIVSELPDGDQKRAVELFEKWRTGWE